MKYKYDVATQIKYLTMVLDCTILLHSTVFSRQWKAFIIIIVVCLSSVTEQPHVSFSSSRTAMLPTCPSWSTTRGLVLPSPPAPAWSSARAALGWVQPEETSSANAITSFAPSLLSSLEGRGQPLQTSRGGLSARWASARWSGSGGSGRQPRGVWA